MRWDLGRAVSQGQGPLYFSLACPDYTSSSEFCYYQHLPQIKSILGQLYGQVTSATLWDSGQDSFRLLSGFPCKAESPFCSLPSCHWRLNPGGHPEVGSAPLHRLSCAHIAATAPADHWKGGLGGITYASLTTILTVMGGVGETGSSRPTSLWGCPLHQPFPLPCFIFFYCKAAPACGQ